MFNKPSWSSDGKCQYADSWSCVKLLVYLNSLCIMSWIICVMLVCYKSSKIDIHSTDTRNRQCIEYQYITIEYHSGRLSKKLVYTISQV